MNQQSFPWLSGVSAPLDVPDQVVTLCRSEAEAVAQCIEIARAKFGRSQADIARMCGWSSTSYLSEIRKGRKAMPSAKAALFGYATGCNLLHQYRHRQEQMRALSGQVTENDRNRAAVAAVIAAWSKAA